MAKAKELNSKAWRQVVAGDYLSAINSAKEGLKYAYNDFMLSGNLAHAYLLSNQ